MRVNLIIVRQNEKRGNKLKKVIEIYKQGWVRLGRYVVFSIFLFVACLPAQILGIIFAPKREWEFSEYPLITTIYLIGFIIYFPFAVYFAAKYSKQFNNPIIKSGSSNCI